MTTGSIMDARPRIFATGIFTILTILTLLATGCSAKRASQSTATQPAAVAAYVWSPNHT